MDNSTHDNTAMLVRYLDGELTSLEKEELEKQLAVNVSLREELEGLQLAREAVRSYGLKQQVSKIHRQLKKENVIPVRSISPFTKFIRYTVAAAASIALVVLGVLAYNFYTLSPQNLFTENYQVYELPTVRGDSTMGTELENAYRAKDYKTVIQLASKPDSSTIRENLLVASSHIELKNYPRAIQHYNKVVSENERKGTSVLKDEAEYYLALAYLRNKDYDQALDLLEKINNNPSHLYHSRVSGKLIWKVKMLKWR